MKVALLAPESLPSWGGVGSYTYNLIQNLSEDIEIHLITIDRNEGNIQEKMYENKNLYIHKITKISSNESFFYNLKFQLSVLKFLKNLHKKYYFDIVHSHSGHLPHLFSQYQNIAPLIVTVHTETKGLKNARKPVSYKRDLTEAFNDYFSPFIETGEKLGFIKSDRLLPISHFTLEQIETCYKIDVKEKSQVIHNGVDTNLFRPISNEMNKEITITFVGRLYAVKGIDILLKAIKILLKNKYEIKLLMVGRGDVDRLTQLCASFMPSGSFSIIGMVQYENMPEIYNQSDIIILPSVYEGCSGSILEAISCKKIIIASNVGGTSEIIGDGKNGLLFESRNSEQLAEKIISVLEETIDIKKMKINARKTAMEHFDWKLKAKEVHQEYFKLSRLL